MSLNACWKVAHHFPSDSSWPFVRDCPAMPGACTLFVQGKAPWHSTRFYILTLAMQVGIPVQSSLKELEEAVISGQGFSGPHLNVDLEEQQVIE